MKKVQILLLLLTSSIAFGQSISDKFKSQMLASEYIVKTDVKQEFVKYDVSALLTKTASHRIFGFIGDNFQRIRIKLISVLKNRDNPLQYFVYGKSMVKDNICEFQGTLTITSAFNFKNPEYNGTRHGKIIGDYVLYENPLQKHVGLFKGVFSSNWYFDKQGELKYDDLMDVADDFANNEFVGTWTNYSGTITKACNWGDGRIPMSGDLDDGTGEFHPAAKYQANGWSTYVYAYGGNDAVKSQKARDVENAEWWK